MGCVVSATLTHRGGHTTTGVANDIGAHLRQLASCLRVWSPASVGLCCHLGMCVSLLTLERECPLTNSCPLLALLACNNRIAFNLLRTIPALPVWLLPPHGWPGPRSSEHAGTTKFRAIDRPVPGTAWGTPRTVKRWPGASRANLLFHSRVICGYGPKSYHQGSQIFALVSIHHLWYQCLTHTHVMLLDSSGFCSALKASRAPSDLAD